MRVLVVVGGGGVFVVTVIAHIAHGRLVVDQQPQGVAVQELVFWVLCEHLMNDRTPADTGVHGGAHVNR